MNKIKKLIDGIDIKLFVISLFILSVAIRFIFANFTKSIYTYYDEVRYYQIAKSIANGNGLQIFNANVDFQKIFYSLLIAPAFLFKDIQTQHTVIALINCIVLCSTIFPVCLLSKKLGLDKYKTIFILLLTTIYSDMCYSMSFMSETSFIPLGTWIIYGTYILFTEKPDIHKNILISILVGGGHVPFIFK